MKKSILPLLCLLALQGCESLQSTFGLDHYQADEYDAKSEKRPLTVPDDYNLKAPVSKEKALKTKKIVSKQKNTKKAKAILGATEKAQINKLEKDIQKMEKDFLKKAAKK